MRFLKTILTWIKCIEVRIEYKKDMWIHPFAELKIFRGGQQD